jgi:hypothetical protein
VKTTMAIFVWLMCRAIYGQSLPERQQGLRVALAITVPNADNKATKTSGELRTVLTRELEKLGDVRVTSLSETYDERLEVIVAGGGCERVFVIVSRPSSAGEILAKVWTLGDSAKEQWINFVRDLNRQVLETESGCSNEQAGKRFVKLNFGQRAELVVAGVFKSTSRCKIGDRQQPPLPGRRVGGSDASGVFTLGLPISRTVEIIPESATA